MTGSGVRTYEFGVGGHLGEHWSAWFGNLTIVCRDDGTSTLTGPVADQAELHGILATLRDIGATLLSVHALADSPEAPTACSPARTLPIPAEQE